MTTYYVSSLIGNDNNAGTSSTAPFATLQVAADHTHPGDTVEVMNGTYTGSAPYGGVVVDITTSGTASAPITFEAAPGQTPIIDSSGGWHGILISASYITVSGFTVVGNAATITQQDALANSGPNNPYYDGNGITVDTSSTALPHNIIIQNNTVYNEPGAGITALGADYVQILNNTVHDNAHWSAYGASGISIGTATNVDTQPGVHFLISGNTVYNNAELVPEYRFNVISDGEGIILDTNPNFVGTMLVQNNTVYANGSAGIEAFLTDNAVITHNTIYGNNVGNVVDPSNAAIFINQSNNVTVSDNIFNPNDHTPPNPPMITGDTVDGHVVTLTGTAEAGSTIKIYDNSTQLPGSTTTNANGQWTFTTGALANGSQSFTATATDAGANVSQPSSALVATINAPPNLVTNGSFETNGLGNWTLGGNFTSSTYGPEIYIISTAESGTHAVGMGSVGSDGTLSQSIATTPGQQYTLSFWLRNEGGGPNDFTAKWNGQALLALTNSAAFGYTEYTYTVTATGSTTTLQFSARQDPSQWDLDNVSVTPVGTQPPATAVTQVVESPSNGDFNAGKTVTLTLNFNAPVTVTGTPTLTLNDNGIATYTGGSGTALNFSYTVGSTDTNVSALAATGVNLPNGATVKDGAGNAANLSLTGLTQTGPQIDTTTPTVASVAESPSSGDLTIGNTVTLTLKLSETVAVTGTPTLTLNDGGIATYTDGSGTSALNFSYTVGSTDSNVSALAATGVNLPNGATVKDGAGNAANLSLTGLTQTGPQIDTTIPDPDGPEPPVLTITSNALTLPAQGSVSLPISVAAVDSDDTISVRISGLTRYETITDSLDNITFRPRHGSVTLTAAEVNSGLTLNSTYKGNGHPVNTLTVIARNSTAGETGTSAAQTITVTDPPTNSSGSVDEIAPAFAQTAAALLAQFGAAGFQGGTNSGGPIGAPPQAQLTEHTSFLTKPHS